MLSQEQDTGDAGGDSVFAILGLLIAIVNGVLYVLVDIGVRRIGFLFKSTVDTCNLIGSVLIVLFSTSFTLALNTYALSAAHKMALLDNSLPTTVRRHQLRLAVARHLWQFLFPGVLVVPFILYPIYKHALSLKALLAHWVSLPFWPIYTSRDLRSNPKVTLREAERGLLPEPIQIEFDYANNIYVASTAFILLFFESVHMGRACLVIVFWAGFTYIAQKICHLRFDMLVEYTEPMLHDCVSYLWALPVAMVAAASTFWAAEAGFVSSSMPWLAFFLSLGIHWVLLFAILQRQSASSDDGTETYEAVRERLPYDFFNTNPVHVLKTQLLREGTPLVFFQRGKEYLQKVKPGKQGDNMSSLGY